MYSKWQSVAKKYIEVSRDLRANRRSISLCRLTNALIIKCITNLRAISSLKLCSTNITINDNHV